MGVVIDAQTALNALQAQLDTLNATSPARQTDLQTQVTAASGNTLKAAWLQSMLNTEVARFAYMTSELNAALGAANTNLQNAIATDPTEAAALGY